MPQVYIKRPNDTVQAEFDLRDWVADQVEDGAAPEDIEFRVRCQPGPAIETEMSEVGLIVVSLGRGAMGRVYDFGVEAVSPTTGESKTDMRKLRVRDPSLFSLLSEDTEIPLGAAAPLLALALGGELLHFGGQPITFGA